jgi:hypothetical protein
MGAVSRPRRPLVYILIHQASVLLFGNTTSRDL